MGFFAYLWLGLLILSLLVEGSTVALVSVWFAVGCLCPGRFWRCCGPS